MRLKEFVVCALLIAGIVLVIMATVPMPHLCDAGDRMGDTVGYEAPWVHPREMIEETVQSGGSG